MPRTEKQCQMYPDVADLLLDVRAGKYKNEYNLIKINIRLYYSLYVIFILKDIPNF
jgi:hypothetical protein